MKRHLTLLSIALVSSVSAANPVNYCGEIKRMRTWVNGTDAHGVWVEYSANPSACPGGFYLPQDGNNRDKVYSFLLASKTAKTEICIQTFGGLLSSRCKINYVMDK